MQHSLKAYAVSLARGNLKAIARRLSTEQSVVGVLVKSLTVTVRKEIKRMCSDVFSSIQREHSETAFRQFSWESIWQELVQSAPVLAAVLQGCVAQTKEKSSRPVLCMIAAMLFKIRNPKMSLVQSVISVILHSGHASTQVGANVKAILATLYHTFFTLYRSSVVCNDL